MFDGVAGLHPHYVPPHQFSIWSDRLAPAFARMAAGSHGAYLADDIAECVASGRMQLWLVLDGADIACVMLTEIIRYPRLKAMRCVGIVGHQPRRWMHILADVERASRECFGCGRFEALVQPGHERLLRTGGWSLSHTLYHKALA